MGGEVAEVYPCPCIEYAERFLAEEIEDEEFRALHRVKDLCRERKGDRFRPVGEVDDSHCHPGSEVFAAGRHAGQEH